MPPSHCTRTCMATCTRSPASSAHAAPHARWQRRMALERHTGPKRPTRAHVVHTHRRLLVQHRRHLRQPLCQRRVARLQQQPRQVRLARVLVALAQVQRQALPAQGLGPAGAQRDRALRVLERQRGQRAGVQPKQRGGLGARGGAAAVLLGQAAGEGRNGARLSHRGG